MNRMFSFIKNRKRGLMYFLAAICFILYFYLTDPNNSLKGFIITLQIVIITFVLIAVIEWLPDIILDPIYGNERELVEKTKETAVAASITLLAKSIRLLGYSIIAAGAIIAFTVT